METVCNREIRHVMVNAKNRNTSLYPSANTYTLHLTTPIKDVIKVELLHAYLPNTIHNLDYLTSNVIAFSNVITSTAPQTVSQLTKFSMLPGFYNSTTMANSLNNTIQDTLINVTYREELGKFMFFRENKTVGGPGPFAMRANTNQMANLLGFNDTEIRQSQNTSSLSSTATYDHVPLYLDNPVYGRYEWIMSDRVIDMSPLESVFLDIEELRTPFNEDAQNLIGGTYPGGNTTSMFGMIPMDVNSGEIKRFKKTSDYDFTVEYPNAIDKIDRLTVRWCDRQGKLLNFNGYDDNAFLLRFHTLRKNLCN